MIASGLRRKMAMLFVAGLCAAVAGCVSDMGAQTASQGNQQLRYFGGPKSPMWSDQQ
jgi:hypothetical protein